MPCSPSSSTDAPGMAASTGEWVASTTWVRSRRAISVSSATRCSCAAERQPGLGLVHDEQALAPEPPGAEQRHERLAVRHRVEGGVVPRPGVGVEPGEQPVHRLGPHEVAPPRRPGVAHHGEPLVQRRLAGVGAVGGAGRAALGVHARRHGEPLDQGRLARAVLADEHRAPRQVEARRPAPARRPGRSAARRRMPAARHRAPAPGAGPAAPRSTRGGRAACGAR